LPILLQRLETATISPPLKLSAFKHPHSILENILVVGLTTAQGHLLIRLVAIHHFTMATGTEDTPEVIRVLTLLQLRRDEMRVLAGD